MEISKTAESNFVLTIMTAKLSLIIRPVFVDDSAIIAAWIGAFTRHWDASSSNLILILENYFCKAFSGIMIAKLITKSVEAFCISWLSNKVCMRL